MYKKKKNKKKNKASYCPTSPSEIIYSSAIHNQPITKKERKMMNRLMNAQKEVDKVIYNLTLTSNKIYFV